MTASIGAGLANIVGAAHVTPREGVEGRYLDNVGNYASSPEWVVRPRSTDEVSAIMRLAHEWQVPVTPFGGGTGVVGGTAVVPGGILISLERMRAIVDIDDKAFTATVEAGAILQEVQEAVEQQQMILPLDLGARGSATIGGNIATNAGGMRVLRWGMMRDMVLGLEAVLADGTVVSSLTKMIKNNTGYDWKQLLIGSEGTLGIVTRAVLRLRPLPRSRQTALVALASFDQAIRLLRSLEISLAGQLSTFELMWHSYYDLVVDAASTRRPPPLPRSYPLYALVEAMGNDVEQDQALFEQSLIHLLETGLAADVVIAQSEQDRNGLWVLRDGSSQAIVDLGPALYFDISMALSVIETYVDQVTQRLLEYSPAISIVVVGHVGDGNLHIVVAKADMNEDDGDAIEGIVYGLVGSVGGSISAEHGIGRSKRDYLEVMRSPEELKLMKMIKRTLDPLNLLNPGCIFRM